MGYIESGEKGGGAVTDVAVREAFDISEPEEGEHTQRRDRVAAAMFLRFFGRDRRPETLSQRDWDRVIRERRAGRVGSSGSLWATG